MQLVLEQMIDLKRRRFGRSTERHETENQISFKEVDGQTDKVMEQSDTIQRLQDRAGLQGGSVGEY